MKLYYILDAYCGWCYGFKESLKAFVAKHPELDINILSGGLFDQGNPISAYPHIPAANQQIASLFQVTFGSAYQDLLAEGSFVANSYHAAAGFGVLKAHLPVDQWLAVADAIQNAFYQAGHSLSDKMTYLTIADQFDLDRSAIFQELEKALAQENGVHPDYLEARAFGVRSYPTLILEKDGQFYDLRSGAMTSDQLEANFQQLLTL